jgi:hypothetical protein
VSSKTILQNLHTPLAMQLAQHQTSSVILPQIKLSHNNVQLKKTKHKSKTNKNHLQLPHPSPSTMALCCVLTLVVDGTVPLI